MKNDANPPFTEAQMKNMVGYYGILRRIHARLATEGYFLSDGRTWNIFKVARPQYQDELEADE